jgi:transcriptional regulator with XRE-family HTH domain
MSINQKRTMSALKKIEQHATRTFSLGSLLWAIRAGEEKTQVEFAELLGLSKQYLSDVENGRRFVRPKTAAEYADKLGYSASQFIRLCLQDILDRDGIPFIVDIKAA